MSGLGGFRHRSGSWTNIRAFLSAATPRLCSKVGLSFGVARRRPNDHFDRLFGTKKAAPAAQPKERPSVPAERPQSQSATPRSEEPSHGPFVTAEKATPPTASTAHAELNRTLKQLEVKLQQEGAPALPIITLRVGEAFGQTVIRWHYVTGYGATSVLLDSDAATQWLTKELSPFGVKIVNPRFTDGSRERGSPERCLVWSVEMQKSANPPRATTLPGAVETSDRRMADLQIHCSLPEAAKHLAPSQIDELVQAMVSCTWNGALARWRAFGASWGISFPNRVRNLTVPPV